MEMNESLTFLENLQKDLDTKKNQIVFLKNEIYYLEKEINEIKKKDKERQLKSIVM